jgi:hypothetical protein
MILKTWVAEDARSNVHHTNLETANTFKKVDWGNITLHYEISPIPGPSLLFWKLMVLGALGGKVGDSHQIVFSPNKFISNLGRKHRTYQWSRLRSC